MEQLRSMFDTIKRQLVRLTVAHKLLIGSLVVILVMGLLLVGVYAGKPDMVELLKGYPAADQTRAAAALSVVNIPNKVGADGRLLVPVDRVDQARAALAESGSLPSDKTVLFSNLFEKQNWINSRQQNDQITTIALQNQLAADIASFKGVKSATVIIDVPETQGLGRSVRKPTAVATVTTDDGRALPQGTVDAVVAYVAGSRAGLEEDRVRVIDTATGRQRKAASEAELVSSSYIEHAAKVEAMTQEKLSEMLRYIPGVIVSVTAQVDVTRVESRTSTNLPAGKGSLSEIRREHEEVTESSEPNQGAAPGLMSNVGMDIERSGAGQGSTNKTSKTEREYSVIPGTKNETVLDPKGMPTMVAVSVSVPRSFVVEQLAASGGAAATGAAPATPTDQELADRFDKDIRPRIEAQIKGHVRMMTTSANAAMAPAAIDKLLTESINVAMIPLEVASGAGRVQNAGLLGGLVAGSGSGTGGFMGIGAAVIDKAVVALLGVVSLGMMFSMVRKAGKKVEVPTAEELVGLPPPIEAVADVIGEAEEADSAMQGIEVDDSTLQVGKIMEQVNDLVNKEPEVAARLINRWMAPADQ